MLENITFQTLKTANCLPHVFMSLQGGFLRDFQTTCKKRVTGGRPGFPAPYPLPNSKPWPDRTPCTPRHLPQPPVAWLGEEILEGSANGRF